MSVGTSRQWLGRLGKTDNGQVAVFGALANNRFVSPVDVRLYLPIEWTKDPKRCTQDPIPYIPEKKTKTGRQSKKYRTDHAPKGVGEVVTFIPESDWTVVELRDTTRGKLRVSAWKQTVYIWDGDGVHAFRENQT